MVSQKLIYFCVFYYILDTESYITFSPSPKKIHRANSKCKAMLIVFFDNKGSMQNDFEPV